MGIEIRVELDRDQHELGAPVSGQVSVQVPTTTQCHALNLGFVATAQSKGTSSALPAPASERLFAGEWAPGSYRYPFQVAAPAWPPSYEGPLISIEWECVASAVLDRNVEGRAPMRLQVADGERLSIVHPDAGNKALASVRDFSARVATAVAILCVVLGGLAAYFGFAPVTLGAILLGLPSAFWAGLLWLRFRRLGNPQVRIEHSGENSRELVCTLWTRPGASVTKAVVTLEITDEYTERKGFSGETRRSVVHELVRFKVGAELVAREPGTFVGTIVMPDEWQLPPTQELGSFKVCWRVVPKVELAGGVYTLPASRVRAEYPMSPGGET